MLVMSSGNMALKTNASDVDHHNCALLHAPSRGGLPSLSGVNSFQVRSIAYVQSRHDLLWIRS